MSIGWGVGGGSSWRVMLIKCSGLALRRNAKQLRTKLAQTVVGSRVRARGALDRLRHSQLRWCGVLTRWTSLPLRSRSLTARRGSPTLFGLLPNPDIGRVAIPIWGQIAIRWYALSYIAGLVAGWWLSARMTRDRALWRNPTFANKPPMNSEPVGDLVVWAPLGVILGGRIGWILFYGIALCAVSPQSGMCTTPDGLLPGAFLTHPLRLIETWEGGMSFHGGLAGVALAIWWFCRRNKLQLLTVSDKIFVVAL